MHTPMVLTPTQDRKPLPALRKTMIAALIANVVANIAVQAVILHYLIPPLAVICALTVVVAGVCATRWRWAPLLGVIWCVVSVIPGIPAYTFNLTHPAVRGVFDETVVALALLLIALVAGMVATLSQDRAAGDSALPRWFPGFAASIGTFALAAMLVAAIPQSAASAGVSPATLAGLPGLTTANHQFDRGEIKARAGQTVALRLDNTDSSAHAFDIDELNVHVAMAPGTQSLALFTPARPGTYTFYCSLPGHANLAAGTGMIGKLVVTP